MSPSALRLIQVSDVATHRFVDRHKRRRVTARRVGGDHRIVGRQPRVRRQVAAEVRLDDSVHTMRLDAEAVDAWAKREAVQRPTQARLALRLLEPFRRGANRTRKTGARLPAAMPPISTPFDIDRLPPIASCDSPPCNFSLKTSLIMRMSIRGGGIRAPAKSREPTSPQLGHTQPVTASSVRSVTFPDRPVTIPFSAVTMPDRPVTMVRNTH